MISLSLLTNNQYTHTSSWDPAKKETLPICSNTYINRTKNMIFLCLIMGIFNEIEGKPIGKILKK